MRNPGIKDAFKYIVREFHSENLPDTIRRDLSVPLFGKKIVSVYGPRRSGKSFFFFTLIKELREKGIPGDRIVYISFEDDRLYPMSAGDLQYFLEAYYELYPDNRGKEIFFFFDEIQGIEKWELFVRRVYEKEKARVFVTGSSSALLSRDLASALRGRTISYSIHPLNFNEFLRFKGGVPGKDYQHSPERFRIKKLAEEYLEWGIFPEIALEEDRMLRKKILAEYFNMLVFRDIGERFAVENTEMLKDLLKFLFTDITSCFSVHSYFKAAKQRIPLSRETAAAYLSYIEESSYFFFPRLFSYSVKVRRVNPRKIISLDTGLRNAACFRFSPDRGKLAENIVGSILSMGGFEVFYWKNRGEVDFVVREGLSLTGINVSFSNAAAERETESLLEFGSSFKNAGKLVLITDDIEKKEKGIEFIPLWKWLLSPPAGRGE